MSHSAIRRLLITLGVVFVIVEIGFSSLGAILGDSYWAYRVLMFACAVGFPIGEAAFMHRAGELTQSKAPGTRITIAYTLWLGCLLGGLIMTLAGAAAREDIKSAVRVAGFTARVDSEQAKEEARKKLEALGSRQQLLEAIRINNRPVRPVAAIEADVVYNATNGCTNKTAPVHNRVCSEHATAKELAQIAADIKVQEATLASAREIVRTTEVVVSKETPIAALLNKAVGFDEKQSMMLMAVLISIVLHIACSFVWHIIPSYRPAGAAPDAHSGPQGAQTLLPPVHVTIHNPGAPQALPGPGSRHYDPGKVDRLLAAYWAEVLPRLPVGQRQQVATHLPDFDRVCAREGVETPSRDVFCALSARQLPNVQHLAGTYWFTTGG